MIENTCLTVPDEAASRACGLEASLQTAVALIELGQILAPRAGLELHAYRRALRRAARKSPPDQRLVKDILLEIAKTR
jgi:ribosomal protein L16/L10AE